MNSREYIVLSLVWVLLSGVTHAVKVDMPGQAEKESSNIVTGTITAIYSKTIRDSSYQWTHCVAAVRVESIEKGDELKIGELVYVRYIGGTKWIGAGPAAARPRPTREHSR
jgi:hypothetical protein